MQAGAKLQLHKRYWGRIRRWLPLCRHRYCKIQNHSIKIKIRHTVLLCRSHQRLELHRKSLQTTLLSKLVPEYIDFTIKTVQKGHEHALVLTLDAEGFAAITKSTTLPPGTVVEAGKKKFDPIIDILSKRIASIKRHFLASPF